jgi:hypothetical protein
MAWSGNGFICSPRRYQTTFFGNKSTSSCTFADFYFYGVLPAKYDDVLFGRVA